MRYEATGGDSGEARGRARRVASTRGSGAAAETACGGSAGQGSAEDAGGNAPPGLEDDELLRVLASTGC